MSRSLKISQPALNSGAALLILLMIITISAASFLLTGTSRLQGLLDRPYKNSVVLSQAKVALIAYSRLSDTDLSSATGLRHRYLPCPDLDGDGLEETPCGTSSAEGWLPWQTLGLPPLRDASATCLRYFVSSSYKQGAGVVPSIDPSLPAGDFTLNNPSQVISANAVAVIAAPGSVLLGQSRTMALGSRTECGSSLLSNAVNQAVNYMDTLGAINNSLPPGFITAPQQVDALVNFNDTLVAILPGDL